MNVYWKGKIMLITVLQVNDAHKSNSSLTFKKGPNKPSNAKSNSQPRLCIKDHLNKSFSKVTSPKTKGKNFPLRNKPTSQICKKPRQNASNCFILRDLLNGSDKYKSQPSTMEEISNIVSLQDIWLLETRASHHHTTDGTQVPN